MLLASAVLYLVHHAATIGSAWNAIERVPLADGSTAELTDHPGTTTETTESTSPPTDRPAETEDSIGTTAPPSPDGTDPDGTVHSVPRPTGAPPTSDTTSTSAPPASHLAEADGAPSTIALIGSDSRRGLEDLEHFGDFDGQRADVIVVAIRDGQEIALLSVPRDLDVEDRCDGGRQRIGEAYEGCGDTHGLSNLVAHLRPLLGTRIEHAVAVDLAGFPAVVDELGGYEICTDYPLRDRRSGLEIDAGCTIADGETTLQWVRSRYTERYRDGRWEGVSGVSDLDRNERQRTLLLDMFERLSQSSAPDELGDTLRAVAPYLTIDDELSITDAAAWAWEFRNAEIETEAIPVTMVTRAGASVLEPTVDVEAFVADLPG